MSVIWSAFSRKSGIWIAQYLLRRGIGEFLDRFTWCRAIYYRFDYFSVAGDDRSTARGNAEGGR